jgi:glycosyltransferase involved in cell wall biosynthesis
MKMSNDITVRGRKKVIYTGPSDAFYRYTSEKKNELRAHFGIATDTIVLAYVGHVIDLKNVMKLPQIYQNVQAKFQDKKMVFWIIGHGVLEEPLKDAFEETSLPYRMFGNVPPGEMPDYMNCIDVLLLISKKEGLGLVCLEALKCGAKVFGTKVGGIPEVIGVSNCAPLDSSFIDNISTLISDYIQGDERNVTYDEAFSWENAVNCILESIKE